MRWQEIQLGQRVRVHDDPERQWKHKGSDGAFKIEGIVIGIKVGCAVALLDVDPLVLVKFDAFDWGEYPAASVEAA